ncbi:thiamine pyrophosphokinase, substrate-binding domain-containing protein [Viridothelium virens]|uniref:Thiamine pyrophosphokinase, substrate-binding domain-containing protein n=1 Tax=Viridothelium virens TaxID=1048519 RepID=A0A6A6HP38_VIRVR|nr:thiamine pyrophosphokinase, substrate-binding domain-containing protein [Viridothelium virens]
MSLPDRIHGDLDSLRPSIRGFYEQKGVPVTLDPDQYSTDFAKALKVIRQHSQEHSSATNGQERQQQPARYTINILGSISGRLDQGLGLLHEMLREQVADPQLDLVLFSERSISFILPPGRSRMQLDVGAGILTANVGIVPIYGPATISTAGLEWDVEEWRTEMGGNVSTSNHVVREMVEVETDARVLFTVERAEKLPPWPSNNNT